MNKVIFCTAPRRSAILAAVTLTASLVLVPSQLYGQARKGDPQSSDPQVAAAEMSELSADFADPPAQWKSRPLWFWNGPLDEGHDHRDHGEVGRQRLLRIRHSPHQGHGCGIS